MRAAIAAVVATALLATAPQAPGTRVSETNVSRAAGGQAEPTLAIDPRESRTLVGASNSFDEVAMRVYSSADGGLTWDSRIMPPFRVPGDDCDTTSRTDPYIGIDRRGRQYLVFLAQTLCPSGNKLGRLFVASRSGAAAAWEPVEAVPFRGRGGFDKPVLAVDTAPTSRYANRVYVAFQGAAYGLALTWSDNGGRTWSPPMQIDASGFLASLAVAETGTLYLSWLHEGTIRVARSSDGGVSLGPAIVAHRFLGQSGWQIPAQPRIGASPLPSLAVDQSRGPYRGRVYLAYAAIGRSGVDVYLRAFRPNLAAAPRVPRPKRVTPPARGAADRFLPTIAVDTRGGAAWVCYYDTAGSLGRAGVRYTCTRSRNGGATWAQPVRAASAISYEPPDRGGVRGYGDYEALAVANGVAHPMWSDARVFDDAAEEIFAARLR